MYIIPSVLWRCWLGGRKGIQPVKKHEWWGAGMVICLERNADLHMAQLMPMPLAVSCFSKVQIGFTFLVLAHPGSPGQRAVKRVCVCVYILNWTLIPNVQLSQSFLKPVLKCVHFSFTAHLMGRAALCFWPVCLSVCVCVHATCVFGGSICLACLQLLVFTLLSTLLIISC